MQLCTLAISTAVARTSGLLHVGAPGLPGMGRSLKGVSAHGLVMLGVCKGFPCPRLLSQTLACVCGRKLTVLDLYNAFELLERLRYVATTNVFEKHCVLYIVPQRLNLRRLENHR